MNQTAMNEFQEELFMYPGSSTGEFDLSMDFFNTGSVDFVGPYATTAFSDDEETSVRVRIVSYTSS